MGLVSFLKILCSSFFNLLAWPSFSLVYPLYASIRAVESDKHFQQCLTYWVLFSITTISESVFANLLCWVPVWPYVKGAATVLLVTPYFDGASYIYNHYIRPLVNTPVNDAKPLPETKDCVANEQNGLVGVAMKQMKGGDEKELIKHVVYENESTAAYDPVVSYVTTPKRQRRYQGQWSCALCLINTTSRKCLTKHMKGRGHKIMEEKLIKEEEEEEEEALATISEEIYSAMSINTGVDDLIEKLCSLFSPVTRSIQWCKWKKPELGWTKLNTDGSVDRDRVGFGGLLRDHKGDPICAYVSKAPRLDIFLVELWSIWRGLVLSVGMGIKLIWVESDSLSVVNTINKKQPYGPKAESCLNQIWSLLTKFEKYKISHSWREANRAADHLAKMDLHGGDIVLWPEDFPDSLFKIIRDDAQGKTYRRL